MESQQINIFYKAYHFDSTIPISCMCVCIVSIAYCLTILVQSFPNEWPTIIFKKHMHPYSDFLIGLEAPNKFRSMIWDFNEKFIVYRLIIGRSLTRLVWIITSCSEIISTNSTCIRGTNRMTSFPSSETS